MLVNLVYRVFSKTLKINIFMKITFFVQCCTTSLTAKLSNLSKRRDYFSEVFRAPFYKKVTSIST